MSNKNIGTADTLADQPAVTPRVVDDMDTIPPAMALEADLILLHAELEETLQINISSTERSGDTVIVQAKFDVKNDKNTENRLTYLILKHYRGMTIHGKNTFIFDVPRGRRMQRVRLIIS